MTKMVLVLDECIYSKRLKDAIEDSVDNVDVKYLGDGVSDNYIRSYMNNHDSVIVTADVQLGDSLGIKSLYLESKLKITEIIRIIKIWIGGK